MLLGSRNVYFQPPASVKMKYPCIKYSLSGESPEHANNRRYKSTDRYEVTTIEHDPDSPLHKKIIHHFQMCSFDRGYPADNLNHKVYSIYHN